MLESGPAAVGAWDHFYATTIHHNSYMRLLNRALSVTVVLSIGSRVVEVVVRKHCAVVLVLAVCSLSKTLLWQCCSRPHPGLQQGL